MAKTPTKPLIDPYCPCGALQPCAEHCPPDRASQQLDLDLRDAQR